MTMARHRLLIARERYKFSCAHATIFPDGTKERLHGHNYQIAVALDVDDVAFDAMIPFAPIKDALGALCAEWKERVLIAERNKFVEIVRRDATEIEVRMCGDRYVLPAGDALFLPIDNISVEALAAHVAARLRGALAGVLGRSHVRALEVTVTESPGQGASCTIET
jgi:6-pyruvoyltetrahydropterin/6-carboxytetrahydropterin synthase